MMYYFIFVSLLMLFPFGTESFVVDYRMYPRSSRWTLPRKWRHQEGTVNRQVTNFAQASENLNELPWRDFQDWALQDHIQRYSVVIQSEGTTETYCLWRTMIRDVPELNGYPIEFVQQQYESQLERTTGNSSKVNTLSLLPFLDDYVFEPSGGVSGRAYGLKGVADGTRIETSSVQEMKVTIPKGYVQTGETAFEVGSPLQAETYSLAGYTLPAVKVPSNDGDLLLKLGASTACLLAGATAIGELSHHLTVNIFWV